MYETGWVYNFDWMKWLGTPAKRRLASRPEPIARATAGDLVACAGDDGNLAWFLSRMVHAQSALREGYPRKRTMAMNTACFMMSRC